MTWNFCSKCNKKVKAELRSNGQHLCDPCFNQAVNKKDGTADFEEWKLKRALGIEQDYDCDYEPDTCPECGCDYDDCECDNEYY